MAGNDFDVAILMSTDTDPKPALEYIAGLTNKDGTPRVEVAAWSAPGRVQYPSRDPYPEAVLPLGRGGHLLNDRGHDRLHAIAASRCTQDRGRWPHDRGAAVGKVDESDGGA